MFKTLYKNSLRLLALMAVFAVLLIGWLKVTAATAEGLPNLKTGDLVFQTSRSNQSIAIMLASKSLYSHMGIIEVLPSGKAVVLEAIATVRETPIADWMARGGGGRLLIKRLEGLTDTQAKAIVTVARQHFGKPYDMFFQDGDDAIYCSELAYLAFDAGAGLTIGKSQRVAELDIDNIAARKLIAARWQKHPSCADGRAKSFEACYAKLLEQKLVTPASIAEDGRFITVFSNYGIVVD